MQNWSNSKKWDEAWFVERDLDSGGQAAAKLVKNRLTGEVAFLKVLNRQNDFERRARFFREATAYGTVGHPLIPKLVESNAHYHEDLEYKLYLIADYVNGITLRQYVDKNGGISFSDATEILFKLIEAVSYCHAHEWSLVRPFCSHHGGERQRRQHQWGNLRECADYERRRDFECECIHE